MEHVGRVFILVQTFFLSFNIWSFGCNLICMSMFCFCFCSLFPFDFSKLSFSLSLYL